MREVSQADFMFFEDIGVLGEIDFAEPLFDLIRHFRRFASPSPSLSATRVVPVTLDQATGATPRTFASGSQLSSITFASNSAACRHCSRPTSRWVTTRTVRAAKAETNTPSCPARATI